MMLARATSTLVLSRRPCEWDRPGRDPFAFLGDLAPPRPESILGERPSLPGEFWLPGLQETGWEEIVREHMTAHRARFPILPPAFDEPLSLDIAAYGSAGLHRDLDNLAHPILAAFERLYCADRRGTVIGYRAYRMATEDAPGVRVQVMPGERLSQLGDAIDSARAYVMSRGPHDDWP